MLDDDDGDKDVGAISVTVIWPTIWFLSPILPPSPLTAATHRSSNYQCSAYTLYIIQTALRFNGFYRPLTSHYQTVSHTITTVLF